MTNKEIKKLSEEALGKLIRQMNLSASHVYSRMGRRKAERFIERLEREKQERTIHELSVKYPNLSIEPR